MHKMNYHGSINSTLLVLVSKSAKNGNLPNNFWATYVCLSYHNWNNEDNLFNNYFPTVTDVLIVFNDVQIELFGMLASLETKVNRTKTIQISSSE